MMSSNKITIINGPNLNLLGKRNQEVYGNLSLDELETQLKQYANVECYQSNSEGEIIDILHKSKHPIVLNPGAYGHYSYAIMDAIDAIEVPVVEVHISDVNNREQFRKNLVLSGVCKKTIVGHGTKGYFEAIDFLNNYKEE